MDDDAPSWWARIGRLLMPLWMTLLFTVLLVGVMLLIMWMWPGPAESDSGLGLIGASASPRL